MNYIGKFISNFREFYNEINSATLTGAIDVIIVKQPDGTYFCSPFHVRFGKIGVLRSREKVVDIEVNGNPVNIHMKLGESGEAFFVEEVGDENDVPLHLATSPLPVIPDIEEELRKLKLLGNDQNGEADVTNHQNFPDNVFINNLSTGVFNSTVDQTSSHNGLLRSSDEEIELSVCNKSSNDALKDNVSNENLDSVEDFKAKRRKKKRASAKRRGKGRESNIPNSVANDKKHSSQSITIPNAPVKAHVVNEDISLINHEDIFQMDDDYGNSEEDEGYPCGSSSHMLSRSISLPLHGATLFNEWPTKKMSCTFTGEFHPFSDGDVTPQSSPISSRPPSPKSDTEYETQKQEPMHDDGTEPSWGWGQLPNVPSRRVSTVHMSGLNQNSASPNADDRDKVTDSDEAEKRSMLGGMLNFMRSTKKMRHMPESEGIYLDSINTDSLDPEVAALYFPKFRSVCAPPDANKIDEVSAKDEDTESGKGPSLPHSPHSVAGAIGGPCGTDSDCDDRQSLSEWSNGVSISLCGGLNESEADFPEERFLNSIVTYDMFTETPSLLLNPSLVVRIGGKYYNWQTAGPIIMSMILYQKSLPEKTTNILINEHMPKKKKAKVYSSWWSWRRSEAANKQADSTQASTDISEMSMDHPNGEYFEGENSIAENPPSPSKPNPPSPSKPNYVSAETTPDGKSADTMPCLKSDDVVLSMPSSDAPSSVKSNGSSPQRKNAATVLNMPANDDLTYSKSNDSPPKHKPTDFTSVEISEELSKIVEKPNKLETHVLVTQPSTGTSSTCSSPVNIEPNSIQLKDELSIPTNVLVDPSKLNVAKDSEESEDTMKQKEKYKKSLRLTSEQIASLDLQNGPNEVVFSVTTAYQGTTRANCNIYFWNYDDKIVISDIDGTITKSDVLGHILPMVGKDWAQFGVAQLFSKIKSNGYQFLYLSARAIGQARITRDYLHSIRQGELHLPEGPLLLSPTSLISALHREVIEKKPEEFKISCLKDIQALFPHDMGNPFYAGFGNKINDTWAYRAVGIPTTRVFTINPRGELTFELTQTFQSSYTGLSDRVDHIFPPLAHNLVINGRLAPSFTEFEEFSYFTYWREPIKSISDEDISD